MTHSATTPNEMRSIALSFPESEEKPHFERTSFRVRNKIFATLAEADKVGVVKLSIADQTALVNTQPDTFSLVGWSHQGWTGVNLDVIDSHTLTDVLETAWRNVAPKRLIATYATQADSITRNPNR